jgi:transposase
MPMLEARSTPPIGVDTHRDRHAAALLDPTAGPGHPPGAKRPGRPCPAAPAGRHPGPRPADVGAGGDRLLWRRADPVPGRPWRGVDGDRPAPAATGPRATPWTPSGPAARPWPATTSPAPPARAPRGAAVLHTTQAAIVQAGADARRQLKALIVTAPERLRDSLAGRPWRQQVHACAGLEAMPGDPVEHRATVRALGLDRPAGPGCPA